MVNLDDLIDYELLKKEANQIDTNNNEIIREEKKVVDKYFMVIVNELSWGIIERSYSLWDDALDCYRNLKEDYKDISCRVNLLRIDIEEVYEVDSNGDEYFIREEEKEVVIYSKVVGEESDYKKQLLKAKQALETIKDINIKMCNIRDSEEKEIFNIMHGIELIKFSKTSGKQRDDILYSIEQDRIKRRAAKSTIRQFEHIKDSFCCCLGQVNKAIESLETEINDSMKNNKRQHRSGNYKHYYDAVGMNYDNQSLFAEDNKVEDVCNNKYEKLEKIHSNNIDTSFSLSDVVKINKKDKIAMW